MPFSCRKFSAVLVEHEITIHTSIQGGLERDDNICLLLLLLLFYATTSGFLLACYYILYSLGERNFKFNKVWSKGKPPQILNTITLCYDNREEVWEGWWSCEQAVALYLFLTSQDSARRPTGTLALANSGASNSLIDPKQPALEYNGRIHQRDMYQWFVLLKEESCELYACTRGGKTPYQYYYTSATSFSQLSSSSLEITQC